MTNLNSLPITELVGIHNGLNPEKPLKSWKRAKGVLIGRIEGLRTNGHDTTEPQVPDTKPEAAEKRTVSKTKPKATGTSSDRTIRVAALEHLCHVAYHEDRGKKSGPDNVVDQGSSRRARSVGLPYDEIIRLIQKEFRGCDTSVACLRWYAVKVRVGEFGYEDYTLPQRRPRAKSRALTQ